MALKKLVRMVIQCDPDTQVDVMLMKGVEILDISAVRNGGVNEQGALQPVPTGKEFVFNYLTQHKRAQPKDLYAPAAALGISKQAISQSVTKMHADKLLKRVAPATYELSAAAKKAAPVRQRARSAAHNHPDGTVPERIEKFVKSQQNGSGAGVTLKQISGAIGKAGISPASTLLLQQKRIKRVGTAQYRVEA